MAEKVLGPTKASFRQDIERKFNFLFVQMGFHLAEEFHDPNLVGNVIVVLKKEDLRLRFIKDRVDFFLDLGLVSVPDKWFGFYEVISWLIRQGMLFEPYKPINKLHPVSQLMRKHAEEILSAFLRNYDAISASVQPTC